MLEKYEATIIEYFESKSREAKVMENIRISYGVKKIVELSEAKKGDNVLVLADYNTVSVGERIASEVYKVDAYPIFMIVPPLKIHGAELPEVVTEMAKLVNVIIAPMTTNLAHTRTRYEAQKLGIPVMPLADMSEELLTSEAFDADFHAIRPRVEKLADLFTKAKVARVTSPKGTDITMSIEGRNGRALHGFAQKSENASPPAIESSIAPVEGTAEGKIVADASSANVRLADGSLIRDPIVIDVHKGFAKEISGELDAKNLRELLESLKDPNVYSIGELGVGMNPKCTTKGNLLDYESCPGVIHIALGTSVTGGKVKAAGHYDTLISEATLELDGVVAVKDGELAF